MRHFCADVRMINNSGIGVYIKHYILAILRSEKYKVTLLGRRIELNKYFHEYDNWDHVEADFPIYTAIEQLKLPILIPRCDIFWSPHYNVPILPIKAKWHLVTIPDVYHLAYYSTLNLAQKIYAKTVINWAVRKADKITTISNYSKEQIQFFTGIREKNIEVIYLGIDNDLFKSTFSEEEKRLVSQKYNLPASFVLFVGNVKPNKNLRGLVKAFEKLIENLPHVSLVITGKIDGFITGDPGLFSYIDNSSKLKHKIMFTGFVENKDLPIIYNVAKLFSFPSIYEGFGFPPLEAMSCGCATVVSNTTSIPEICENASYYVDPSNTDSIANGMQVMLTDSILREHLVEVGQRQCQKFSWLESSIQFMEAIDKLID